MIRSEYFHEICNSVVFRFFFQLKSMQCLETCAKNVRTEAQGFIRNAIAPMGDNSMGYIAWVVHGVQKDHMEIVHAMETKSMMRRVRHVISARSTGTFISNKLIQIQFSLFFSYSWLHSILISYNICNIFIHSTGVYPACICKEPFQYSKDNNLCRKCPEKSNGTYPECVCYNGLFGIKNDDCIECPANTTGEKELFFKWKISTWSLSECITFCQAFIPIVNVISPTIYSVLIWINVTLNVEAEAPVFIQTVIVICLQHIMIRTNLRAKILKEENVHRTALESVLNVYACKNILLLYNGYGIVLQLMYLLHTHRSIVQMATNIHSAVWKSIEIHFSVWSDEKHFSVQESKQFCHRWP